MQSGINQNDKLYFFARAQIPAYLLFVSIVLPCVTEYSADTLNPASTNTTLALLPTFALHVAGSLYNVIQPIRNLTKQEKIELVWRRNYSSK